MLLSAVESRAILLLPSLVLFWQLPRCCLAAASAASAPDVAVPTLLSLRSTQLGAVLNFCRSRDVDSGVRASGLGQGPAHESPGAHDAGLGADASVHAELSLLLCCGFCSDGCSAVASQRFLAVRQESKDALAVLREIGATWGETAPSQHHGD